MDTFLDLINDNKIYIAILIVVILIALIIITILEKKTPEKKKQPIKQNNNININNSDKAVEKSNTENIVYVKQDEIIKDAKEKLEKLPEKLETETLIGQTSFEMEQEEMSVISFDELKKINYNVDEINDALLLDEGNEPITIDELYKLNKTDVEKNIERLEIKKENLNNQKEQIKRFKNSDVISPVFGIYNEASKNYNKQKHYKNVNELDSEIKKTEDFLNELRNLKNKLE